MTRLRAFRSQRRADWTHVNSSTKSDRPIQQGNPRGFRRLRGVKMLVKRWDDEMVRVFCSVEWLVCRACCLVKRPHAPGCCWTSLVGVGATRFCLSRRSQPPSDWPPETVYMHLGGGVWPCSNAGSRGTRGWLQSREAQGLKDLSLARHRGQTNPARAAITTTTDGPPQGFNGGTWKPGGSTGNGNSATEYQLQALRQTRALAGGSEFANIPSSLVRAGAPRILAKKQAGLELMQRLSEERCLFVLLVAKKRQ